MMTVSQTTTPCIALLLRERGRERGEERETDREIQTCTINSTRIAQIVESETRDLEVQGSNPDPGSNFFLKSKINS